jgi:O-antigen/teichoic acid export membrane protein
MNIGKKDIIWAYAAQFFQIASNLLVLPLILRLLDTSEIALYYLMLNVGALVLLFDFGFSNQFSRNISYVFSGAQELKKEGLITIPENGKINYHLLKIVISTSRTVYRILALIVIITMLLPGTWYIYNVTNRFTLVSNTLLIWLLYSISVAFNIYYLYLKSFLLGKGAIAESRKATVYSRIVYLCIAYILLLLKLGLIGIVIADFSGLCMQRIISKKYFFTEDLKTILKKHSMTKFEFKNCFQIIWHNTKKIGIVAVSEFAVFRSGLFFSGLFLSAKDISSYGLMLQLMDGFSTISLTMNTINMPMFAKYGITNNYTLLLKKFSITTGIFYILFLLFVLCVLFLGNAFLMIIGSKVSLPNIVVLTIYSIMQLLWNNAGCFKGIILSKNSIPWVKSTFFTSIFIIIGIYFVLKYSYLGIIGIVLIQLIGQLSYTDWKWPSLVCKEFGISFKRFLFISCHETVSYGKKGLHKFITVKRSI